MAEWSKALAWKVSIRQNRIEGSNPSRSAILLIPTETDTKKPAARGDRLSLSCEECQAARRWKRGVAGAWAVSRAMLAMR